MLQVEPVITALNEALASDVSKNAVRNSSNRIGLIAGSAHLVILSRDARVLARNFISVSEDGRALADVWNEMYNDQFLLEQLERLATSLRAAVSEHEVVQLICRNMGVVRAFSMYRYQLLPKTGHPDVLLQPISDATLNELAERHGRLLSSMIRLNEQCASGGLIEFALRSGRGLHVIKELCSTCNIAHRAVFLSNEMDAETRNSLDATLHEVSELGYISDILSSLENAASKEQAYDTISRNERQIRSVYSVFVTRFVQRSLRGANSIGSNPSSLAEQASDGVATKLVLPVPLSLEHSIGTTFSVMLMDQDYDAALGMYAIECMVTSIKGEAIDSLVLYVRLAGNHASYDNAYSVVYAIADEIFSNGDIKTEPSFSTGSVGPLRPLPEKMSSAQNVVKHGHVVAKSNIRDQDIQVHELCFQMLENTFVVQFALTSGADLLGYFLTTIYVRQRKRNVRDLIFGENASVLFRRVAMKFWALAEEPE